MTDVIPILNQNVWSSDHLYRISKKQQLDFNILKVKGSLSIYRSPAYGVHVEYVEGQDNIVDSESLIHYFMAFLDTYRKGGRLTIAKNIWAFMVFQHDNAFNIGKNDGVSEYLLHLHNEVRKKTLTKYTASGRLSAINKFLIFSGKIEKKYEYAFGTKLSNNTTSPYRKTEFKEIISLLFFHFEQYDKLILEHIDATEEGRRQYSIAINPNPIFRYKTKAYEKDAMPIVIDYIASSNYIRTYMNSCFYIFALFTWGNTTPIANLQYDEIHLDDEGVETDYVFKGRGQKFVRLTIGKSEIDGKRCGYNWFKRFIRTRSRIIDYLSKHENVNLSINHLFFGLVGQPPNGLVLKPFDSGEIYKLNQLDVFDLLRDKGIKLENINTSKLRKSAEQYSDQKLSDPFAITEKAQHEWSTYKKNYSKGNPFDAKEEMFAALNSLVEQGIGTMSMLEKNKNAKDFGIKIVSDKKSNVNRLLNGLGCQFNLPKSDYEKKFHQKQGKRGRSPKACADFSNCVDCEKSCLIEDSESIYNLLSFKHAIEYGIPLYVGSNNAKDKFGSIIEKIDMRLAFVNPGLVAKAEKKIRVHGVSKAWEV